MKFEYLLVALTMSTHANATPPSKSSFCAGIWDRSATVSRADWGLVRGVQGSGLWSTIERENGKFDWTSIDVALTKAGEGEGCFYTQINVGPNSPDWIYSAGVPKVTTRGGKSKFPHYPYYLNDNYKKYYFRMIDNLANFLKNHKYASKVAFVEMDTGCTGDNVPYKGTPSAQYKISSQQWDDFEVAAAAEFKRVFQSGTGRSIPLMSNSDAMDAWSLQHIDAVGIKGNAFVRFHHLNGERSWVEKYQKNMLDVQAGQKFFITRAEMDQTFKMMPAFRINEELGFYWGTITGLNQGLLIHDFSKDGFDAVKELPNTKAFDFYNKYAPQVSPEHATGAFIALHEGLDGNDFEKYSVAQFGATDDKQARAKKICAAHAQYGCQLDDISCVDVGQVTQRHEQKGYNDVGYDIWPTNYMRWLEQIDANQTSVGLFRIGGKITSKSSVYSRFARGLRHKEQKTGMYFALHQNFFKVTPVSSVAIRVVWYDSVAGSWQLEYTTTAGSTSTAWDQKMQGDKQWKEATFKIANAAMKRTHERGSDFAIVSKDGTDAVFHMIEVTRESSEATIVV